MGDWDEPIQRAAVWYVAAFAALSAVLIAGVSLTSFDFEKARHPVLAAMTAVIAVGAAAWVGFAASRVLAPRWTSTLLQKRQERFRTPGTWQVIASSDRKVLAPLYVEDGFNGDNDSPRSLWARAQNAEDAAVNRLKAMVDAANQRSARRWFSVLTVTAPVALALILLAALAWGTWSKPDPTTATSSSPISVRIRLNEGVDSETTFGSGCKERERTGVAVEGTVTHSALVAMPATSSCRAKLIQMNPAIGSMIRS